MLSAVALLVIAKTDVRVEVIDLADRYYQSQFADTELTKKGVFGTSRVESSRIKGHGKKGGDPSYERRDVITTISIYGNQGKKLNANTLERRYNRFQNGVPAGDLTRQPKASEIDDFVKKAASQSLSGGSGPFTTEYGTWLLQVRRINLSKPECLPCHEGMKQGDAVALIAYLARKAPGTAASVR